MGLFAAGGQILYGYAALLAPFKAQAILLLSTRFITI
jgi:hypothetical protein